MKDHLADKWMTIDKVAKGGGKFVAGASGNGYIRPARGFGTKWNQFVNHIEKGLGLKAADIMEKGLSFVAPKKDQPWFLYLGLDRHARDVAREAAVARQVRRRLQGPLRRPSTATTVRTAPTARTSPRRRRITSARSTTPTSAIRTSWSAS